MEQAQLSNVIATLLQQAGRAVERGAELAPQALEAAGKYLQFLAIAEIFVGLMLASCAFIAMIFFKKGFDLHNKAREDYYKTKDSEENPNSRRSKRETDEFRAFLTIMISGFAGLFLAIGSIIVLSNASTWASAFDHRAALVGYTLEMAKPQNRR